MRTWIVSLSILCAVAIHAPVASACQECREYFDWASGGWCPYCEASYCGSFSCNIKQYGSEDYCVVDDYGCFEYGGNCPQEPSDDIHEPARRIGPHAMKPTPAGEDEWRVVRVRMQSPRARRVNG